MSPRFLWCCPTPIAMQSKDAEDGSGGKLERHALQRYEDVTLIETSF